MVRVYNKNIHKPSDFKVGTVLRIKGTNKYVIVKRNSLGNKVLKFTSKPVTMQGGAKLTGVSGQESSTVLSSLLSSGSETKCSDFKQMNLNFVMEPDSEQDYGPRVSGIKAPNFFIYFDIVYTGESAATLSGHLTPGFLRKFLRTETKNASVNVVALSEDKQPLRNLGPQDNDTILSKLYSSVKEEGNSVFRLYAYFIPESAPKSQRIMNKVATLSDYLKKKEELSALVSPFRALSPDVFIQDAGSGTVADLQSVFNKSSNEAYSKNIKSVMYDVTEICEKLWEKKFYLRKFDLSDFTYYCTPAGGNANIDVIIKLNSLDKIVSPRLVDVSGSKFDSFSASHEFAGKQIVSIIRGITIDWLKQYGITDENINNVVDFETLKAYLL